MSNKKNNIFFHQGGHESPCEWSSSTKRCRKGKEWNREKCQRVKGRCKTKKQHNEVTKKEHMEASKKISVAVQTGKELLDLQRVYVHPNRKLSEQKKKFCRCVLHVAKNNPRWCNQGKEWKKGRKNPKGKCYNPYTVCASSVKTTTGGKSCGYVFQNKGNIISKIPFEEVIAYSFLNYELINTWAKQNSLPQIDDLIEEEGSFRDFIQDWYNSKKTK